MQTIVKNCAGIDVHKMMVMVAIRKETPECNIQTLTIRLLPERPGVPCSVQGGCLRLEFGDFQGKGKALLRSLCGSVFNFAKQVAGQGGRIGCTFMQR